MVFNPAAAVDAFISYLIAKANISLPVACAILAVLSGLCNTVSVLVITYPAHQAASKGVKRTALGSGASFVGNLALMGVSISLGIAANGRGPVAIAFPLGVGSNLLSIMILQTALGIAHYTKNMRVGTLVLACAVMILPDVGPLDLPPGADALSLLEAKPAMMFNSVCTVLMGVGFYAILRGWVKDNDSLLFLYALVGGAGTVLSTAISKLVQLNVGFGVLIALLIIYVLLGAFCLLLAATANSTLEDPSMFVPVSAGVNLVLTFIAGVCIWGDWLRITNPLAYVMVYVLIVLGTYLVSSFGGVGNSHVKVAQDHVDAAEVVTKDCWDSLELSSIRASDCDLEATKHLIQLCGRTQQKNLDGESALCPEWSAWRSVPPLRKKPRSRRSAAAPKQTGPPTAPAALRRPRSWSGDIAARRRRCAARSMR
eukprot:TRINITY_DN11500_c0_g1_i2.p1 TRINITY_DN11500_c0_g1~~TRINITY_DN11500_c0_g1_i2.p1  ORF type:complete len:427 (+),score=46.66 TRINITY_DN11500_c0_g1_i2:79-1359(+)